MGAFFMKREWRPILTYLSFLLFFFVFLHTGLFLLQFDRAKAQPTSAAAEVTFVLDAGHGGEDCGAIGVNGVLEKNLNMEMTQLLGTLLQEAGYRVVYTRTEDRLLYTEEQDIAGQRKTPCLSASIWTNFLPRARAACRCITRG